MMKFTTFALTLTILSSLAFACSSDEDKTKTGSSTGGVGGTSGGSAGSSSEDLGGSTAMGGATEGGARGVGGASSSNHSSLLLAICTTMNELDCSGETTIAACVERWTSSGSEIPEPCIGQYDARLECLAIEPASSFFCLADDNLTYPNDETACVDEFEAMNDCFAQL